MSVEFSWEVFGALGPSIMPVLVWIQNIWGFPVVCGVGTEVVSFLRLGWSLDQHFRCFVKSSKKFQSFFFFLNSDCSAEGDDCQGCVLGLQHFLGVGNIVSLITAVQTYGEVSVKQVGIPQLLDTAGRGGGLKECHWFQINDWRAPIVFSSGTPYHFLTESKSLLILLKSYTGI